MWYYDVDTHYMDDEGRIKTRPVSSQIFEKPAPLIDTRLNVFHDQKPFRLLDLPRELRNKIYEFALVQDIPIECAPLIPGRCRDEEFWENTDETGEAWHGIRYKLQIVPSLYLLRANKQICEEATPIFWSQRFRFTNEAGWIALEDFLGRIGPAKSALLKDITICHPAFSTWPDHPFWLSRRVISDRSHLRVEGRLEQFARSTDPWSQDPESQTPEDIDARIPHGKMLATMTKLRNLRLVLHADCDLRLWQLPIATDPIYDTITANAPDANIEVIHLEGLTEQEIESFKSGRWTIEDGMQPVPTGMQETFDLLSQRGIEVYEQRYDQHTHYPVQPNQPCVNKGMCDYMIRYTAALNTSDPGDCQGTTKHLERYGM